MREATLGWEEWDEADESILFHLTLGPLLAPTQLEEADAFLHHHRPADNAFAFVAPPLPRPPSSASPEQRWQAIAQHLAHPDFCPDSNPYSHAVFAFTHPLCDEQGLVVPPGGLLWANHRYHQVLSVCAPGLGAEELATLQPHLELPRLNSVATWQGSAAEGVFTLLLQPVQPQATPWVATVSFRPASLASGPIYLPLGEVRERPNGANGHGLDPFQRLQLFEWLTGRLPTRDQLKLLDRFLLPGKEADPQLLLARAELLQKEGHPAEAVETLLRLAPSQRTDEMVVLLLECATTVGRFLDFAALLDEVVNWDESARVRRMVRALVRLPEEMILPLAMHVCHLAPIYAHMVWQEVGPTLQQRRNRLALVQFLQGSHPSQPRSYLLIPPDERYAFLARNAEPERLSNEFLDTLMDAGFHSATPSGFAPFFLEWMARQLRSGERDAIEQTQEHFQQVAASLSTTQEETAVTMLMEALKRAGLAERAIWLALGRIEDSLRSSDFERAERWLREARNVISSLPAESRTEMMTLVRDEDERIKQARHDLASSFAPRYGSDPGLAPILRLYGIEVVDAFWADLAEVLDSNDYVARQLIARLDHLQQFGQQSGSTNASIHSLSALQGNVWRIELTDSARMIFKKMGRTIRLIALYANHDAYDGAIKKRWELMNRIQRG